MMPTETEDEEEYLYDKRCKAPEPKHWDGKDVTQFNIFKHKAKEYVLGSLPFRSATTAKGVRLAASLLDGAAYEWYIASIAPSLADRRVPSPFLTFEELFHKMAVRFGIYHQEQNARQRLRLLTTKPWTGDYHSFFTLFQTLIIWCTSMDDMTKRNEFMFPLSDAIKTYVAGHVVNTWEDAHQLISNWIINKGQYNQTKAPSYFHAPSDNPSSTATPMEIGAVPTADPSSARRPNTNKLTASEFWKDKQCLACGEYGHSKNYKGCPKHKDFTKKPAGRTAAVEYEDCPSPAPVSYAGAVASTSATSSATSTTASSAEAGWRTDVETKLAILTAALKD